MSILALTDAIFYHNLPLQDANIQGGRGSPETEDGRPRKGPVIEHSAC